MKKDEIEEVSMLGHVWFTLAEVSPNFPANVIRIRNLKTGAFRIVYSRDSKKRKSHLRRVK